MNTKKSSKARKEEETTDGKIKVAIDPRVENLEEAKKEIVKQVQSASFLSEFKSLQDI